MGSQLPDDVTKADKDKAAVTKDVRSEETTDAKAAERLSDIIDTIVRNEPLEKVVNVTMAAIAEIFGITQMIFMVTAEDLSRTMKWSSYGYPKDRAQIIVDHIAAEYYPKAMSDKIFSDHLRVSKHGYYLNAEEWLKIVASEPFSDTPAYYARPERSRVSRESPDEWHEADSYLFEMKDRRGHRIAWLELEYSSEGRLLSVESVQKLELFADMITLALLRERIRAGRESTQTRAIQRTELMEDVLKISSSIVSERDVGKLSDMILSSVSSLFGFRKVSLVVYDEADGVFKWRGLFRPANPLQLRICR